MNKIDICVIIAVTMISLLMLPTFSLASTNTNLILHNSGFVVSIRTPINKCVVAYGFWWPQNDIIFVANHFTLLETDFGSSSAMQSIKAINPNVKILGYKDLIGMKAAMDDWAEVNTHENWFVHDATGHRIKMVQWGWYLMDVSSQGWRQHWVSHVNGELNNTAYDGLLADDAWNTMASWYLSTFDATVPASVISGWHNNVIGMLQYIKANLLHSKILIVNSDEWSTDDYLNIADGQMLEGYEHASWTAINAFGLRPTIDVLARKSATGKIILAESGTDTTNASQAQINNMSNYCYASFLIGMSGSQTYWGWNQRPVYDTITYLQMMDTNMGSPTGAYYSIQNVYTRDFTGGKVLFNPSANSHTINLGGTYVLLNGTSVTSIRLAPYTGETLLSPT
jgi:hypothetical protein